MKPIPKEIDGAKVLCFSSVDSRHKPTGKTNHALGDKPTDVISGLAICQYEGDDEFYLFYCDSNWNAITDTLHTTLDKAKEQAGFEYLGIQETWESSKLS